MRKQIFDVKDHFLGRVRLIETETSWILIVDRRDIEVEKETKEIIGSGTWVAKGERP